MKLRPEEETNNFTLLRLLLALMVVLGHFKLLSGTNYPPFPFNLADAAVDCFFVVSGYLIAGSYERTRGLWSFYVRRVFRLYPMYACIVIIQAIIMLSLLPSGPLSEPNATLRYFGANLLFANFLDYDIGGVLSGLSNPSINPSLLDPEDRDRLLLHRPASLYGNPTLGLGRAAGHLRRICGV